MKKVRKTSKDTKFGGLAYLGKAVFLKLAGTPN
jgi:hypothetical protein